MENTISINSNQMAIREYKGQRVVTFKDIDAVHDRANGTARKRFADNKKHFIEDVDYFKVRVSEIRTDKNLAIPSTVRGDIILITESGYLMLAKSFTDDLAWTVQRELVNNYFRKGETSSMIEEKQSNTTSLSKFVYKPKQVNVDDCIVALEVLRAIKYHCLDCKQEYEQKDPAIGMVECYEKEISVIDSAIQSVGVWLTSCSANKRFI